MAILAALSSLSGVARGGDNPDVTFVLHARAGGGGTCTAPDLPNCTTAPPTVNVEPDSLYRMFHFLNNVNAVSAFNVAFQWDEGWVIDPRGTGAYWLYCISNKLCKISDVRPHRFNVTCSFDCVQTGPLIAVGRVEFRSGASGCLYHVQSDYWPGNSVDDCRQGMDLADPGNPADAPRFGRICVGEGGHDACPRVTPVARSTWGAIKSTYE